MLLDSCHELPEEFHLPGGTAASPRFALMPQPLSP